MFELKPFDQENVNNMIEHIDQLPYDQKMKVTARIREDMKCFILENFLVAEPFQKSFKQTPDSVWREFGFASALALEEKDWNLKVVMPDGDPPVAGKCKDAEDEVSVGYDDGFTATKTIKWTWGK